MTAVLRTGRSTTSGSATSLLSLILYIPLQILFVPAAIAGGLLGAGYDTRADGPFRREGVTFFEVDQPSVQRHKRAMSDRAGQDSAHVLFVPVDFSQDDLEKLEG